MLRLREARYDDRAEIGAGNGMMTDITEAEANAILNAFAGWKPGQKCEGCADRRFHDSIGDPKGNCGGLHDIPPTDFFADTSEAREAVRLLKDEFVRRTHITVGIGCYWDDEKQCVLYSANRDLELQPENAIESHAIALAIASALQERKE